MTHVQTVDPPPKDLRATQTKASIKILEKPVSPRGDTHYLIKRIAIW